MKLPKMETRYPSNIPRSLTIPPEIIYNILLHTDLVAPFNLMVNFWSGLAPVMRRIRGVAKNSHTGERICDCGCREVENCGCWKFPSELFLVSRTVYGMAMDIFYGKNYLVFCQQETGSTNIDSHFHCFDKLPPLGLKLLRKVELRHKFGHGVANKRVDHETDWKRLGQVIEQKMTPSQLHLIVDTTRLIEYFFFNQDHKPDGVYKNLTHSHYESMAQSLKGIGLAKLHIYFVRRKSSSSPDRILSANESQFELEQVLEKHAMGQDYDSLKEGKYKKVTLEDGNKHYVRPSSGYPVEEVACASHSLLGEFEWKEEA